VSESKDLSEAKEKFGRLVVVESGDMVLAFRPLDRAKITDVRKKLAKTPDLALDILTNVCEFQCVVGKEHFDAFMRDNPLAADTIADELMTLARGAASITVK
jgi:hypothetical protein